MTVKIKGVKRGFGSATQVEDESGRVLLIAQCSEKEGTRGAEYQRAYHSVSIGQEEAENLLAQYGKVMGQYHGDLLLYPLHVTEYRE